MADTRGPGHPTDYREEYVDQAYRLCLLGAIDADLAAFFDVTEQTVNNWKHAHPEFFESLKRGKAEADANVADSLYHRAMGYEHPAVKIVADAKTGAEHIVDYVERYPPDTVACIFWLKNRQPRYWRDRHQHELSGPDGGPIAVAAVELRQRIAQRLDRFEAPHPAVTSGNGNKGNGSG